MTQALTIVGGGLAGLSLGIALRCRNIPVTVYEASNYPRHRVCGEFISGISDESLEYLGIRELFSPAVIQRSSAWYVKEERVGEFDLPVAARGISRHYLDEALCTRFEKLGGVMKRGIRVPCEPRTALVWCAGRRPGRSPWMGLKCHLADYPLTADLEMHIGRRAYAGLARVEGGMVNLCGLFPVRKKMQGADVLASALAEAGLGALAEKVRGAGLERISVSAVAGFRMGWQKSPSDLLALGDSFAMIPPFTGNGMSMAFESARSATDFLASYANGEVSWEEARRKIQDALRRKFFRRMLAAGIMHPFLTSSPGQSLFTALARRQLLPFPYFLQFLR